MKEPVKKSYPAIASTSIAAYWNSTTINIAHLRDSFTGINKSQRFIELFSFLYKYGLQRCGLWARIGWTQANEEPVEKCSLHSGNLNRSQHGTQNWEKMEDDVKKIIKEEGMYSRAWYLPNLHLTLPFWTLAASSIQKKVLSLNFHLLICIQQKDKVASLFYFYLYIRV